MIWVITGRLVSVLGLSALISLKMFTNTGTMIATTRIITTSASPNTTAGYVIAERTWRRRASSRSS